ncbi:hypothetical protein Taro_000419 [Colocasia esculenta]|uniref:BHLH domain-containing protein n=1 Tax=Colocasia esculenta TaxID=4460 RepID=A0A843TAM0_COLES|nr:hypothetical protein [Colocasia esculenta]
MAAVRVPIAFREKTTFIRRRLSRLLPSVTTPSSPSQRISRVCTCSSGSLPFCSTAEAMEGDLHQNQMPEGFFASVSLLTRIAEVELWRPPLPPPPQQPCDAVMAPPPGLDAGLDCRGQREGRGLHQVGCHTLHMVEQPQDKSEDRRAKAPKREQMTGSDLPISTMEPSSYLDDITRKRLNLGFHRLPPPLPFPSHVSPPLPPPSCSLVDQRAVPRSTASRPSVQQSLPPNTRSRGRRKGISERIRLLGKLMPGDRKMTISDTLEEARKYVKFLEAQVAALQCMPSESRFACPPPSSYAAAALPTLRGLERLTRQQLLHVLVRSPLVQGKLCERGLCVFATEQVILMRQAAERETMLRLHQRQMVLLESGDSTSTVSDD